MPERRRDPALPPAALPRRPGSGSTRRSCARLRPDADPATILPHLAAIERIAAGDTSAGPMARLGQGERFHWLVAPSSTVIQASEVHTGLSDDPAAELDHLFERLVG